MYNIDEVFASAAKTMGSACRSKTKQTNTQANRPGIQPERGPGIHAAGIRPSGRKVCPPLADLPAGKAGSEESSNPQLFSIYVGIPLPYPLLLLLLPPIPLPNWASCALLLWKHCCRKFMRRAFNRKPGNETYTVYLGGGTPTCLLPENWKGS